MLHMNMQICIIPKMNSAEEDLLSWLRAAVADRRLTQVEVARATGVDQSQVSRILSGQAKRSSANVVALCRFAAEASRSPVIEVDVPVAAKAQVLLDDLMDCDAEQQRSVVELLAYLVAARNAWRRGRTGGT
jgi:transcriptional regulator with XRE-family HTH domain